MYEKVGTSTSRNPKGLHGLFRENFTLPYIQYTLYYPGNGIPRDNY
jgi:hypothetical protein